MTDKEIKETLASVRQEHKNALNLMLQEPTQENILAFEQTTNTVYTIEDDLRLNLKNKLLNLL